MKNLITTLILVIAATLFFIFPVYRDYTWHKKFIASLDGNWHVLEKQNNLIDPVLFWTIFKQPIVRMQLIDLDSFQSNAQYFIYREIWVNYSLGGGKIEPEIFIMTGNCETKMIALYEEETSFEYLRWRNAEGEELNLVFDVGCSTQDTL